MAPSLSLLIFVSLFLKPVEAKSTFLKERDSMRASKPLNKNLYENRAGIQYIFDKLRGGEAMVPKAKLTDFMKTILKSYDGFDNLELHTVFVHSLEIVVDDHRNAQKYWYLTFPEYIEYICRIALKLYKVVNGDKECKYEYKVSEFFRIIFEAEGIADP
jgi:hypothetical protein